MAACDQLAALRAWQVNCLPKASAHNLHEATRARDVQIMLVHLLALMMSLSGATDAFEPLELNKAGDFVAHLNLHAG